MYKFLIPLYLLLINNFLSAQTNHADYGAIFIQAINSNIEAEQRELIQNIFSQTTIKESGIDKLLGFFQMMHKDYSPLDYHHSEILTFDYPSGKKSIMHIYARQEGAIMWKDFQMRLDTGETQKIKSVGFIADVSEPITLPNGGIEQTETINWLKDYLEKLKTEYSLYGSILIAKDGKKLFEEYFGYADIKSTVPISPATKFNIASGGKMFTALCIAKLAEENKLNFDDKISKYISGFSDTSIANKITIGHLLSHTSGIAEYWTEDTDYAVLSAKNINDHLKIVLKCELNFQPGSAYEYSNSNYIILGAIIEKIAGNSYNDFVKENIFIPAGMNSTGYYNYGSENLAVPLTRGKSETEWVEASHGIKGSSAGGAYSDVTDMLKFSNALKENKIISRNTLNKVVSPKNSALKEAGNFDYGYGFIVDNSKQEPSYGHGGTANGVNFEFKYFPWSDITFIIFSNQDNGAYDDLKRNVIKLITGDR
jgi:CubicO group peptidase (beta-lactamase class C family)